MKKVLLDVVNKATGTIHTRLVPLTGNMRVEQMVGENEEYFYSEPFQGRAANDYIVSSRGGEVK